MKSVELSWLLLRRSGRRGLLGTGLTLAAVAVSTTLLMFVVAVNFAFAARAEREAWRNPVPAEGEPVAVQAVHVEFAAGRPITVVDVAALTPNAPAPPGLSRFPAPGEAWMSPALARLVGELPADRLADRFPRPAGELGEEALIHPDELVAVVGRAPDDPAVRVSDDPAARVSEAPRSHTVIPATRIAGFTGEETEQSTGYRMLAAISTVLMVVPLLVFGGAAARLTVARRDQRLAALRLVGATPGQVVGMTVAEAMIVAVIGAVVGVVLYGLAAPLLAGIPIAGGEWFVADLWPGVLPTAGVLLAVPLLVGVSAVVGLRRVVVSPLGVARRETPPGLRFIRVVVFFAVVVATPVVMGNAGFAVAVGFLAAAFLVINLVGPWVVALIGRIAVGVARRPATLLAGRRLIDDPRSSWRTVSGVALVGFLAGFLGLLSPDIGVIRGLDGTSLSVAIPADRQVELAKEAHERLAAADVPAKVEAREMGRYRQLIVRLGAEADTALMDRARTVLHDLVPGRAPTTPADEAYDSVLLFGDVRTGTIVVLAVAFLVAVASSGIAATSSVLDRRQTYALLRLAGTPLRVLNAARRAETLIPLTVMGGGAIGTGVLCGLPFASIGGSWTGLVILLVCVGVGFTAVLGAGALSAPLLRSVTTDPAPRPD